MAMIEKGYDASLLQGRPDARTGKFTALKVGIVAIGIGLGFLVGNILETFTRMNDEVAYFSMISLFGGIGLIVYYMLVRNKDY
ncbi:membrane protein [Flammeovirgaceae bacterium 311]|nr:membrane protein [Flammeovirgaceae bacterium 311]